MSPKDKIWNKNFVIACIANFLVACSFNLLMPVIPIYLSEELRIKASEIGIWSSREGKVPGTHAIKYISEVDEIEIKHTAYSRTGFAFGAVLAAEWLRDRIGIFGMEDLLNEKAS